MSSRNYTSYAMPSSQSHRTSGPPGIIASAPRAQQSPLQYGTSATTTSSTSHWDPLSSYANGSSSATATANGRVSRSSRLTGTTAQRAGSVPASSRQRTTKTPPSTQGYAVSTSHTTTSSSGGYSGSTQATSRWANRSNTPGRYRLGNTEKVHSTLSSYSLHTGSISTANNNPQSYYPRRTSRVTLVLDLDETLVHSSFDPVAADLHIPVIMDGERYTAYVKKRPHVDHFLARCCELFDVIVWTASLSVYADPLIDELCAMAKCGSVRRMFREHCTEVQGGGYAKDLRTIGRKLDDVAILDNSPSVAIYQPNNLIPISSWYDDEYDTALLKLLPMLERLSTASSIYDVLSTSTGAPSSSLPWTA